mmetsp:Transcript_33969/g.88572  ORF Transcript_33969/g.88572 Transcript_33969/m.88572 type:complete len:458 (+) Transcript_33969:64-1437(+)
MSGGVRGFAPSSFVWAPLEDDDAVLTPALVEEENTEGVVLRDMAGRHWTARGPGVDQLCPQPGFDFSRHDVCSLGVEADLETIELFLRSRFCKGLVYSQLGDALIAINPNRHMPFYGRDKVDEYQALDASLPPHVFSVGAQAYKHMCNSMESQVVMVVGEPGSGKSQAAKHVVDFLNMASSPPEIEEKLGSLHDLLAPFISRRVIPEGSHDQVSAGSGWSSTKAIPMVTLEFDADQFICGVSVNLVGLELGSLSSAVAEDERTFDVFYALLRGADEELDQSLDLVSGSDFHCTRVEEDDGDEGAFVAMTRGMEQVGLTEGERLDIFRVLAGIMHLSNISFSTVDGNVEANEDAVTVAAEVLQVDADALGDVLVTTEIRGSHEPLESEGEGRVLVERLLELMYARLVRYVVDRCTALLSPGGDEVESCIAVLQLPHLAPSRATDFELSAAPGWRTACT